MDRPRRDYRQCSKASRGPQGKVTSLHIAPCVDPELSASTGRSADYYRLDAGASVRLLGRLVPSRGAGQSSELLVDKTEILGSCDPEVSSPR